MSEAVDPPSQTPYTLFGAIGGLVYGEVRASTDARRALRKLYYVKTAAEREVAAYSDEYFAVGTCVEIIPTKDAQSSSYFAYSAARISRSDKC
jgi:hypothetical protein